MLFYFKILYWNIIFQKKSLLMSNLFIYFFIFSFQPREDQILGQHWLYIFGCRESQSTGGKLVEM